jgi:two-component SAPR family response regulator
MCGKFAFDPHIISPKSSGHGLSTVEGTEEKAMELFSTVIFLRSDDVGTGTILGIVAFSAFNHKVKVNFGGSCYRMRKICNHPTVCNTAVNIPCVPH